MRRNPRSSSARASPLRDRARPATVAILLGVASWLPACGETSLELITPLDTSTSGGFGGSGGNVGTGGADGTGGTGGLPSSDTVCSPSGGSIAARIALRSISSGDCVESGPITTVLSEPAFETELEPCAAEVDQIFLPLPREGGAYELRHEETSLSVDVEFASTDDGTRVVVYEPNQLFNQRFFFEPSGTVGRIHLAARHADGKCLEVVGATLQLWPCDESPEQTFELQACEAASN